MFRGEGALRPSVYAAHLGLGGAPLSLCEPSLSPPWDLVASCGADTGLCAGGMLVWGGGGRSGLFLIVKLKG